MEQNKKFYRCGYCGIPTNKDGEPLNLEECKKWESDNAILVHGYCCINEILQEQEYQEIIITKDMAIDAGDLSLEGRIWQWHK